MISKDQAIDALLGGYNDIEQMGRFNVNDVTENSLLEHLSNTFGMSEEDHIVRKAILSAPKEDRHSTIIGPVKEGDRFLYVYDVPLRVPNLGTIVEDVSLEMPGATVYLYLIAE